MGVIEEQSKELIDVLDNYLPPRVLSDLVVSYCSAKYKLRNVLHFRHPGTTTSTSISRRPHLLCIASFNNFANLPVLAVLDAFNFKIHWYDVNANQTLHQWDNTTFYQTCKLPRHIHLASMDNKLHLLVADTLNSQVKVYNLYGDLVQAFGSKEGKTQGIQRLDTERMLSPCGATVFFSTPDGGKPRQCLAVVDEFFRCIDIFPVKNEKNGDTCKRRVYIPHSETCLQLIGSVNDMLVLWDVNVTTVCTFLVDSTNHADQVHTWSTGLASLTSYSAVAAVDQNNKQLVVVIYHENKKEKRPLLLGRIFCLRKGKLLREIHLLSEKNNHWLQEDLVLEFGIPRGVTVLNDKQDIAISFAHQVVIFHPCLC